MRDKRRLVYLAFVALVAGSLACSAPTPTTTAPQPSFPTATPHPLPTLPPQKTVPPAPTDTPAEAKPTSESPEATETATTEALPSATPTPQAATPTPTETSTPSPSEGPLDFDPPTWIHSWEPLPDGQYKVVVTIHISGGAPPFTIKHEHNIVGQTSERDFAIEFTRGGCSAIVYNITVESADGQEVSKDYWIGVEAQPWCDD